MKKEFICQNCNSVYTSYKENSKFCSKECKKDYNNILCNCDYCNKEITVYKNKIEKIKNGKHKNIFCSKICHDQFQSTSVDNICENCGKIYKIYNCFKDVQKFCSKECYKEYRFKNSINYLNKKCPVCNMSFVSKRKEQIYCSDECKFIGLQNREIYHCDYCRKPFERKRSEIQKNKQHYCSNECRRAAMFWSKEDTQILFDNYKKMKYKDMTNIFSEYKSVKQIGRRAIFLGLTTPQVWSQEEVDILINNYSTQTMSKVKELLPERTYAAILGKARTLNLTSYFFQKSHYTEVENNYIKDNYLSKSDEELGRILNRTQKAINLHLFSLGLKRPKEDSKYCNYLNLKCYVRNRIVPWRNKVREDNGFVCELTGRRSDIIVHHIRSFNLIFNEVVEMLDFPLHKSMELYTQSELDNFVDSFLYLQEQYNSYVCINKEVHKQFHNKYGYGNNTVEQWNDFVEKYYNNKEKMVG